MPFSTAFASILDTAARTLEADGRIPYRVRGSLRNAGEADHGEPVAYVFSGLLAIECAKRSYGVWLNNGGWSELHEFERLSLNALGSAPSPDEARQWLERAEADVMQAFYDGEPRFQNTAGLAGLSCVRCVATCLDQFAFDAEAGEGGEIEIEPDHWDSAFLSACALAGGAPWQRDSGTATDEQARTGFWQWYLEDAVPMAYGEAVRREATQDCR